MNILTVINKKKKEAKKKNLTTSKKQLNFGYRWYEEKGQLYKFQF